MNSKVYDFLLKTVYVNRIPTSKHTIRYVSAFVRRGAVSRIRLVTTRDTAAESV